MKNDLGLKVGDKVKFSAKHEETGHRLTVVGELFEIDHKDTRSDEFPTFHVRRKNGDEFWYFGPNIFKKP